MNDPRVEELLQRGKEIGDELTRLGIEIRNGLAPDEFMAIHGEQVRLRVWDVVGVLQ